MDEEQKLQVPSHAEAPRRRPGRAPLVVTALVAILVLAVAIASSLVPRQQSPAATEASPSQAIRLPLEIGASPSAPPTTSTDATKTTGTPAAAATGRGIEAVQVCGGEWVAVDAEGHADDAALARLESVRNARARTVARLRTSSNELDQTVAAWLSAVPPAESAAAAASAAGCDDDDCRLRHFFAALGASGERVATHAVSTHDPVVYALVYAACAETRKEGNCALLSPEQWARLDPGNARPWLYALQLAKERGDPLAQDEALYRIATSERDDSRASAVLARLLDAAPTDDATLFGTTLLAVEALGRLFAAAPAYQPLVQRCRTSLQADANAWQLCAAAAERLAERSDSMLVQKIGISMARRLGLPPERFDRVAGEIVDATRVTTHDAEQSERESTNCRTLRRELATLRLQAQVGEVAARRAARGSSAASPAELVRLGREDREARERREAIDTARRSASAPEGPGRTASAAEGLAVPASSPSGEPVPSDAATAGTPMPATAITQR